MSADWFVQGALTRIGDIFDRLTGRGWKPSSSLATSQLIEKMKELLDAEARTNGGQRKFVPHNIGLRMQWDKFSTDSEEALEKLRHEFLTAAVDHINDRHYYTKAPLNVEIRPDYFTSGVKLLVSFEKFSEDEAETAINVSAATDGDEPALDDEGTAVASATVDAVATFSVNGQELTRRLRFARGTRVSVGRTKENDLAIDDISISKFHATLMMNADRRLVVADTGSTNGTFINGERISYGKAIELGEGDRIKFGAIGVRFDIAADEPESPAAADE